MRRTHLLAVLAVTATIAACGAPGGDDEGGAAGSAGAGSGGRAAVDAADCPVDALESAEGPVEIDFWHSMTAANEETLAAMTEDYNASQDRVRVNLAFQGTYDESSDKFVTALRGGDLPGLVQLEETRLQLMIDSGAVLPAQACVEADDYDLSDHLEVVLDQFTVEEVLWPMPFNVSSPLLYYNTKAFERAGLDPDAPPTTFEELRQASEALVAAEASRTGFALELSPGYIEQWLAKADETLVDNDNGRSDRATATRLDQPIVSEVYEFLDGLIEDGLATSVGRNPTGADHLLAIASGDAAMTIASSAALGSAFALLDSGNYPGVGAGVAPFPGPDEGGVLVGGASLYLVDKGISDEQKAASWDFAKWLNEPEQQARWHVGTGYIPIRKSAATVAEVTTQWEERPQFRVAYDQLLDDGANFGGPVIGPYKEVREAVTSSLERMVVEDQPPDQALAAAKEAADAAITDYNDRVG
ncbi:MAG: ABC transporter substrate-binding protein [Acidimicrobiia bacterium]|nr:ABC transporter substrate-binding protein [Acidimicrobiia bacterium]